MRSFLFYAVLAVLICPAAYSYGFSSKGEDCSKCHILKKDEAAALLKNVIKEIRIVDIRTIPLKAVWEITIDKADRKGLVYLDFSKKYLFHGSIIDIKEMKDLTKDRLSEINRVDISKIPLKDALVMGEKDAGYKVIVFDDPD